MITRNTSGSFELESAIIATCDTEVCKQNTELYILVIEIGEDCLGICTSTRAAEEKTIDSPSVATPKVELWLLLASLASNTPDIISHKTDCLLTPILGAYCSSRGPAVTTLHSPHSPCIPKHL